MKRLLVRLDAVAWLREGKGFATPDPVEFAFIVEGAGAHGISLSLPGERRYVQERDAKILRQISKRHLNLEMGLNQEAVRSVLEWKPDSVTFVGNNREETTRAMTLDAVLHFDKCQPILHLFREAHITTRLFVEPEAEQLKAAHRLGAQGVELYTGHLAAAWHGKNCQAEIAKLTDSLKMAEKLKLPSAVHGGLDLQHLPFLASFTELDEIKMGHSIISRALIVGMASAVHEVLEALRHQGGPCDS